MNLPIRKEAQALIDKYYHENSGYLFDIFHGDETAEQIHERAHAYSRRINKVLKDICNKHGINKRVTTYTARHTSANKMLSEGVKIEMISPLLGHTDIKTTQIYTQKLPASKTKDVIDNIAM